MLIVFFANLGILADGLFFFSLVLIFVRLVASFDSCLPLLGPAFPFRSYWRWRLVPFRSGLL